jgi:hypothetical protein
VRERDGDDDAFKFPIPAASSFSFIASSTAFVSGDVWGEDIEGLADSDFSFILFSISLVSTVTFGAVCLRQCFEQQPPARRKISTCKLK